MKAAVISIALLAFAGSSAFAADAKAGQAGYDKSCKGCHGPAGVANPGIAKMFPTIPDLSSAKVQDESDTDIKQVITAGKGKMKPVTTLTASPDDVIAYVRTLKK